MSSRPTAALLLVAVTSCESAAPRPSTEVPVDQDGDGFAAADDCNDQDPGVHPYADEVCDGVDQDCDGIVDEDSVDAFTWFPDDDADGFGDAEGAAQRCAGGVGWAAQAGDCDDEDALVHPNANEVCDDLDNDCDGVVDGDGAQDAGDCHADEDGDGFGLRTVSLQACTCPPGTSPVSGDCDDSDAAIHPAAADTWYDGIDADCDGRDDYDADGDGYRGPVDSGEDCDDSNPSVNPGAAEICGNGLDDDCSGRSLDCGLDGAWSSSHMPLSIAGPTAWTNPGFGEAIAALDDDADGHADLLVSAPFADPGAVSNAGAAYLFRGPVTAARSATGADVTIDGQREDGWLGSALATGDVDSDGYDDVVMWSVVTRDDRYTSMLGFLGPLGTASSTPDFEVTLTQMGGGSLPRITEDLDGDGVAELLVGSSMDPSGAATHAGVVRLFLVGTGEALEDDDATASISGEAEGMYFGQQVDPSADLNGDGAIDLVVAGAAGGSTDASSETLWVFHGPVTSMTSADADVTYVGPTMHDNWGPIAAGGDSDGDGYPDLVAASVETDGLAPGSGVLWSLAPRHGGTELLVDVAHRIDGVETNAPPTCLAWVPDADGDGDDELVVGTGRWTGATLQGRAYLLTGPLTTASDLHTNRGEVTGTGNARLGGSCAWVGDIDGDGLGDVAVGARGDASLTGAGVGGVFLLPIGPGE
jgi:hypothetical protein